MTCVKFAEGLLSDYTDGALPHLQSLRVGLHLRRCSHCAGEVAALQNLNRNARQLYVDAAPQVLPVPRTRRTALRPLLAIGAAAAVAGLWFAPEMPGRPRVAFADVENAMRQVRTAHWTMTSTEYNAKDKPYSQTIMQVWARMKPLLLATRIYHRSLTKPTQQSAAGGAEMAMLRTPDKRVTRDWFGDWHSWHGQDNELYKVMQEAIGSPNANNADLPVGMTSGKAVRWTLQSSDRSDDLLHFRRVFNSTRYHLIQEVWADPQTLRVVRRKEEYWWGLHGRDGRLDAQRHIITDVDDFRYNEPIPPDVLALKPSPGVRIYEMPK